MPQSTLSYLRFSELLHAFQNTSSALPCMTGCAASRAAEAWPSPCTLLPSFCFARPVLSSSCSTPHHLCCHVVGKSAGFLLPPLIERQLLSCRQGETVKLEVAEARSEIMAPLSAASMESYSRAYPYLVKLHMLQARPHTASQA